MTTSRPALLVVTHVDWDHAWQRPQALATALAEWYDVTVVSPVARRRGQLATNPRRGIQLVRAWRLPGSLRSRSIYQLNARLVAFQVAAVACRRKFDTIVANAPECGAWLQGVTHSNLIYDCMDDALAFAQDAGVAAARAADERALIARAARVVVTAEPLLRTMQQRGAGASQLAVVRNGYDPLAFPVDESSRVSSEGPLRLGYFGTVGPWLDFEALRRALDACPRASALFIGPRDGNAGFTHPRVRYVAPLPNRELRSAVAQCDMMILPFRDTPLTRAVDPVKLYEYIAVGKPIVCRSLPALQRFAPFVRFYDSATSLADALREANNVEAAPRGDREDFLANATWRARALEFARTSGYTSGPGS